MRNTDYKLLGHRGARAEALENSAIGFTHVQNLQVNNKKLDGVEFDIQMTNDGQFVVVHDEHLERLATSQSWIADKTLTELQTVQQTDRVRYQANFDTKFLAKHIMKLIDLLPLLQNYKHIEFEIKSHKKTNAQLLVKNLLSLFFENHWQTLPITLTSFDTNIIYQLQNQQRFLPYRFATGMLLESKVNLTSQIAFLPVPNRQGIKLMHDTFNLACELGSKQVGIYYALITPKMVEIARRYGLKVTAWTVNDILDAEALIDMGVDCIITDFPTKFCQNLKC